MNTDPSIIKAVQSKVGATPVDGQPGLETWGHICQALNLPTMPSIIAMIKAVQSRFGLATDGIDGHDTWNAIYRSLVGTTVPTPVAPGNIDWLLQLAGRGLDAVRVKQIAVRGFLEGSSKENREDIYDDLIVRIIGDEITQWRAAVDPSAYLIKHPINIDGAAQLKEGLWHFALGIHKGNPNWPCFIQAEDFVVHRLDGNGNVKHDDVGDFGIHEHSGGASDDTGRFSAGCQIIQNPDGYWGAEWFKFFLPQKEAMLEAGQKTLPYLLMDAEDIKR